MSAVDFFENGVERLQARSAENMRIKGLYFGGVFLEVLNDAHGRRFAHVVDIRLGYRDAEYADGGSVEGGFSRCSVRLCKSSTV